MKTFLTALAAAVIIVLALGFFFGWFRVSTHGNSSAVSVHVNHAKIAADKNKVVQDVKTLKSDVVKP